MKISGSNPFERRLRLLIAREFASRGYYLDVEGMFSDTRHEGISVEESELLANVAAKRGDWHIAEVRFKRLALAFADTAQGERYERLSVYAGEQRDGWGYRLRRLFRLSR